MSLITTNAIIIRSINYKDSSKILTLLSREYGRFSVIAHGTRKLANTPNAAYQIGNFVRGVIYKKQDVNNIGTISQIGILDDFMKAKMDFKKVSYLQYCIEFVYKNTEDGEKNQRLFDLLLKGLRSLNTEPIKSNWKVYWDYHGLISLGFNPSITKCISCGKQITEGIWLSEGGGLSCGCNHKKGIKLDTDDITIMKAISLKFPPPLEFIVPQNIEKSIDGMINEHASGPFNSFMFFSK